MRWWWINSFYSTNQTKKWGVRRWWTSSFLKPNSLVVGGRVTDIHWIADTRRVRLWIQIHTHERLWVRVWVKFCLAGMDSWTIYPCTTRPIAIPKHEPVSWLLILSKLGVKVCCFDLLFWQGWGKMCEQTIVVSYSLKCLLRACLFTPRLYNLD
jgi:hypothetical protein